MRTVTVVEKGAKIDDLFEEIKQVEKNTNK